MSLIADLIRHQQPTPPLMAWGLLDRAPSPYGPDPVVFGTWWRGPPGGAPLTSRCAACDVRGAGAACWLCGRPWSAP